MSLPKFVIAIAAAAVSFGSMAQSASATLVAYDGFDGAPVNMAFPAPGGDTGSATASSLTYDSLLTSGVARQGGAAWALKASLASPVNATTATDGTYAANGQVWMSWLYKTDAAANPWTRLVTYNGVDSYGASERFNLGYVDVTGPGFTVRGSLLGQPDSAAIGGLTGSTTYLLVAKYDFGTAAANDGSITLWVNPTLGGAAPSGGSQVGITGADESLMAFTGVALEGGAAQFDEVRIGGTFADVTPMVPEPTSIGLAVLGASACLLRRRARA